jgi:predicted lipase
MLKLACLSYDNIQPTEQGVKTVSIDDCVSGIQLVARTYPSSVVIAFRGSDSLKDAVVDMKFYKKSIPHFKDRTMRLHSGFVNSYKTVHLRNEILKLITPDVREIKLTGHSYGAALAALCAADLQYNFPNIDYEVYLFGCPRIGNSCFSRVYNRNILKTFRIENGNDVVTRLPPAFLGYRHIGIKIHVGKKRIPFVWSLKDHGIREYTDNVICPSDDIGIKIGI